MRRTIIYVSLLLVLAMGGWWLDRAPAPRRDTQAVSVGVHRVERSTGLEREPPIAAAGDEPMVTAPPLDGPHARQRRRLRETADQLRTRRTRARRARASEVTIRALEVHLARVERQLGALGDGPGDPR